MQALNLKRWIVLALSAILLFSTTPGITRADSEEEGIPIHLKYASFDPLAGGGETGPELNSTLSPGGPAAYLLQFEGPVLDDWKEQVEEAGVRLYAYVPDYAFIVRADPGTIEAVSALPYIRWIGPYRSEYRQDPSLSSAIAEAGGPLTVTVQTFPDANLEEVAERVRAMGGRVEGRSTDEVSTTLQVEIEAGLASELAGLEDVLWVEPSSPMMLQNDVAAGDIIGTKSMQTSLGLYGKGQIVAVADTGLDTGTTDAGMSLDFRGRIVSGNSMCGPYFRTTWDDQHGHGTHVTGSVLGNGALSGSQPALHQYGGSFAGVAPEAQLVFQAIDDPISGLLECIPSDLVNGLFKPAYNLGARIHTNSWGGQTGSSANPYGGYSAISQAADSTAWTYKNLVILYAAGNSGQDKDANGVVDLDSINAPGTAKNVITVGASENDRPQITSTWGNLNGILYPANPINSDRISNNVDGMAAFSSRGPTDDGRIKPDLVAPGTFIISARSHASGASQWWATYDANYVYNGGTSMATPLTAGAATLVREWLVGIRDLADPSAALVKALLIHGAADMSPGQYGNTSQQEIPTQLPNNVTGWGRVDLKASISPSSPTQVWLRDNLGGVRTGESATYTFELASGSPLRFTLVWTDYPALPSAGKALVNNLNLEVVAPDGTHYYGNTGLYTSTSSCLQNGMWDNCNNVESVKIPSTLQGTYTVIVHGSNVPQGPQAYALVGSGNNLLGEPFFEGSIYLPAILRTP